MVMLWNKEKARRDGLDDKSSERMGMGHSIAQVCQTHKKLYLSRHYLGHAVSVWLVSAKQLCHIYVDFNSVDFVVWFVGM